mgnify:CR=1 FL=1
MEKFYSIREVADILGYHYEIIYAKVRKGEIKAVKVFGSIRIYESELRRLVSEPYLKEGDGNGGSQMD